MRPPPEDPKTFLLLGHLEHEAGELEQAAAAFQHALELEDSTSQGPAAFGLGLVRLKQGKREAAYAAWRLAIATRDPEYAPRAACFLAVGQQQEGNRTEARKAWELALEASSERKENDPPHPDPPPPGGRELYETVALLGLGCIAAQEGEVNLALGCWRRATAILITRGEGL
jgi:tetratricopeptide (TPR) repeat protein